MITEIGAENNTTTVIMMPSDFMSVAKQFSEVTHNPKPAPAPALEQELLADIDPAHESDS
jgi:hypothetical protein